MCILNIEMDRGKSAFSLVEVLIFVSILSVFFVVAAAVVSVSLRNLSISEHKVYASHYATELIEWVRSQSQDDWNAFVNAYAPAGGQTYCFNSVNITGWGPTGNCSSDFTGLSPAIYNREVTITGINSSCGFTCQARIEVTVMWKEAGIGLTVPVSTVISVWE